MDKIAYCKDIIYKTAAINSKVNMFPHQKRAVDKPGDGIIVAHGVGSGKTATGIARFERLKGEGKAHKALVIVPSGLRENFGATGVGKFTDSKFNIIGNKQEISSKLYNNVDPNADYNIISYDIFKKDPERYLKESGADTVISDEFHKSKNSETAVTKTLKDTRHLYKNYIGLTGSVISNGLSDIQPLVDIASDGHHNLGATKEEFEKKWLKRSGSAAYKDVAENRRPVVGFNHRKELAKELGKYVDYTDYDDIKELAHMPDKDLNIIKVPLSKEQAKIYKGLLRDNPKVRAMVTNKRLETLKDSEAASAFSALAEERKLMNSVGAVKPGISLTDSSRMTPKTKRVLDDLDKYLKNTPDGQALLFSHLINGGSDVLEAGLKDRHIEYGKFVGKGNKGVTEASRQQDVKDYNGGKKKVMIVSSAGGEGISLNDTNWEGVLDPHYNPEKMKQMEARGIRSGGLSNRPKAERVVKVNRYMATMPKTFGVFKSGYKTPDEFIYEIAKNKERSNGLLFDLLKSNNKPKQTGIKGMLQNRAPRQRKITDVG